MINEDVFRLKKNGEPYCNCFCRNPELIENYDLAISDTTQTWNCHHRREKFYSQKELKERGEYFDRPPEDLIFLTKAEHNKVDSACKRMSEAHKGKPSNNRRKVLCVETHIMYESATEAEKLTGTNHSHISAVCKGKLKTTGGYHWEYVQPEI